MDIEIFKANFIFDDPVSIATKTLSHNHTLYLRIQHRGITAFGEAVPTTNVTKDSTESVISYLKENPIALPDCDCDSDSYNGTDTGAINLETIKQIHRALPQGSPTARTAIDFALHDLWGKQQQKQVSQLYTDTVNRAPNCITLFGEELKQIPETVNKTLTRFPHLTVLKVKLMGIDDVKRCRLIKGEVDRAERKISYILDCNQSFETVAEAIYVLKQIDSFLGNILLVEEPGPAQNWNFMKQVHQNLDIPVYADESAVDLRNVYTIIEKQCASGINIKLQKTGGIWPAKRIAETCRQNGLNVMLGCMFESAVSIAAGVHFARSTENVTVTDLDFDLQMHDAYRYRPTFEEGTRLPAPHFGLGAEPDFDKLVALKKAGEMDFEKVI